MGNDSETKAAVVEQGRSASEGEASAGSEPNVQRGALGALALSMLLASLGTSSANVALPTLATAFAAPIQAVQWVVIAYLLTLTVLAISVGRLGDLFGHRRVLLAGIVVFTLASLGSGLAPSLWWLIAARAIQGIGAAVLMSLSVALIRKAVPTARVGSAMGLLGTLSAVGTAMGPSAGGILIAGFGWPAIFLAMVPLGLVNAVLVKRYLPASPAWGHLQAVDSSRGIDWLGSFWLSLALASYVLAVTFGSGAFAWANLGLMAIAMFAGGAFVWTERRAPTPLIRLTELRGTVLVAGLGMNALVATVIMTTFVVGPFYLAHALGLNEALVGVVMAVGPVISALSGVPAGRLVDRFGAGRIVLVGLTQMAIGSLALAFVPVGSGVVGYIVGVAILTPGYQLFLAANNTTVMLDAHRTQQGVVSGMLNMSRSFGLITGASVMGAVFAQATGTSHMASVAPEAVATGMRETFSVALSLLIFALVLAVSSRRLATRTPVAEDA